MLKKKLLGELRGFISKASVHNDSFYEHLFQIVGEGDDNASLIKICLQNTDIENILASSNKIAKSFGNTP